MTHIPPYSIIGFEGKTGPIQTPALRSPVLRDARGDMFLTNHKGELRLASTASLQGIWTRIPPAAAAPTDVCLILGPDDVAALAAAVQLRLPVSKVVISAGALICTRDEAAQLLDRIAEQAAIATRKALAIDDRDDVYKKAWWLSRAARHDHDISLAIFALEQSNDPDAALVLATSLKARAVPAKRSRDHGRTR